MQQYIALLRGINVGGNNIISMSALKQTFESYGAKNVLTYINSGNVIFNDNEIELSILINKYEAAILKDFSLNIKVAVITTSSLIDGLANAPRWWNNDEKSKHNLIIVIPPKSGEEIMQEVGLSKPEYEQVSYYKQFIFWSAPIETFSKTRWSKIVTLPAYKYITIRNANTALKLKSLLK